MPISSDLFAALEKGGGLTAVEAQPSSTKAGTGSDAFLAEAGPIAERISKNIGVSPNIVLGLMAVETGWGKSVIPGTNNWGNIKDFRGGGKSAKDNMTGSVDKYRVYGSGEEFADGFSDLMRRKYPDAIGAGDDAGKFTSALKRGGYAEDPGHGQKIARVAETLKGKVGGTNWMDERTIPRDDGRMGAQRRSEAVREGVTAGDLTKAFGASALSGLGDMAQGLVGEPLAWLANKAAGTEEFEGKNLLSGIADSVREGMTEGGKLAREDVPAGDVFQPDTWKLPETTGGMLMIGADGLGSLIPSILPFVGQAGKAASLSKAAKAAELAGDVAKASELAMLAERASRIAKGAGAAGGFGMTGGAAASEVRKNVEQALQGRSHEDLVASVPLYRDAFEQTGDAKIARQAVINGAAQYATLFSGAMGAVGGGVNAKLLEDVIVKRGVSAALGRASGSRAVRSAVGAGAGAVGEGLQEVSEKVGQNAGENVGLGRPSAESVTRDSFGDFVGGAMVGGPMGAGGGGISPRASKAIATPVQPTIEANSPLSNMASIGQAEAANAAQAAGTPQVDATAQEGEAGASSDPIATRLAAMQSFVEDKAFIQALRGTQGYGPESVTEMLSAFAKARNPNIDPMVRERALSDLEGFIQGFSNRPNFVFGENAQERPNPPGQQVVPVSPDGRAVSRPVRRDDGRTLDGEIITRPDAMAGANPNQLAAPPVLGLPTEEALAAKRQADADYDQAFQDLLKAEQLGATEAELAEYQRTLMEAERLRNELAAQLSDTDARGSDAQRREAEARRREILARVIEEGISGVNPVADVSNRFAAELRRQGYQNADPTEAEAQSIRRAVDVANAREDDPLPSLPNEADFYEPPKQPRATAPKAEPKPKQQPARKLTPLEIRKYIAAGAALNGDTLTLPDGTTIKLKGPQIAAAREAIRKAGQPQVESAPVEASDPVVSEQEAAPQEVETADGASESEPSRGTDEPVAEDLAGEKIDSEWTAFAPETGTLGIPRDQMPQIKAEHRGAMTNFMNARGVDHRSEEVPAEILRPTQAEFSPEKVKKAMAFDGGDRSILVSSDGYVLDGHHQWLAKRETGNPIKVIRLDAPIAQLVPLALEFPSSTTAGDEKDNKGGPVTSTPFATFDQGASALKIIGDPTAIRERLTNAGIKHLPRKDGAAIPQKDAQEAARRTIPVRIDTYRVDGVPARLADVSLEVMESGEVTLVSPVVTARYPSAETALQGYADSYKDAPESAAADQNPIKSESPASVEEASETTAPDQEPIKNAESPTQVGKAMERGADPMLGNPREAYVARRVSDYIAKHGGEAPRKALDLVRAGALREYDRNSVMSASSPSAGDSQGNAKVTASGKLDADGEQSAHVGPGAASTGLRLASKPFAAFYQGVSALKVLGDTTAIKRRLAEAGIRSLPIQGGVAIPQGNAQGLARKIIPVRIDTYRMDDVPGRLAEVKLEVMEDGGVVLISAAETSHHKDADTALAKYAESYGNSPKQADEFGHQDPNQLAKDVMQPGIANEVGAADETADGDATSESVQAGSTATAPAIEVDRSELIGIFEGLSSRGLARSRAKQAAKSHRLAKQIDYVQEHFHDILLELESRGVVEINCP